MTEEIFTIKVILEVIFKTTNRSTAYFADSYLQKDISLVAKWKSQKVFPSSDDLRKIAEFSIKESSRSQQMIIRSKIEELILSSSLMADVKDIILNTQDFGEFILESLSAISRDTVNKPLPVKPGLQEKSIKTTFPEPNLEFAEINKGTCEKNCNNDDKLGISPGYKIQKSKFKKFLNSLSMIIAKILDKTKNKKWRVFIVSTIVAIIVVYGLLNIKGYPSAAGDPAVIGYGSQQHTYYRDTNGNIQHIYYDGSYHHEQISEKGSTAAGNPAVIGYENKQHTYYRDTSGNIQHIYFDGSYHYEQLIAKGYPTAAGDPVVIVYGSQQHTYYRDTIGNIQHIYYDGSYHHEQLNAKGYPTAAGNPAVIGYVIGYVNQQHTYYCDISGNIQHIYYDGSTYHYEQLNTKGYPTAAGDLTVTGYENQQHIYYRDTSGNIQHIYYDGSTYHYEQLNTKGYPAAAGDPAVISYGSQQHIYYRDTNGNIQHIYYDGSYHCDQLNGKSGITGSPTATGDPVVIGYGSQQHTYYRDTNGNIQHIYYDGSYHYEQLLSLLSRFSG